MVKIIQIIAFRDQLDSNQDVLIGLADDGSVWILKKLKKWVLLAPSDLAF